MNLSIFFLFFITYSIIGCLMEIIKLSVANKRFVKRGFLIGPWCPIYGFGYIVIYFITYFKNNIFLVAISSFFIIGFLEYIVSFLLEKLFNARWWDYSKRKFNINGRICLHNLFLFSFYSLIAIYILNPFLYKLFLYVPWQVTLTIFLIFLLDSIISLSIISKLKIKKSKNRDNTEEISEKVKEELKEELT